MRASSSPHSFLMERNIVTQRIAVGLTLLAALFASACGDDPKPQPAEATLAFRSQPGSVRAGEALGTVEVALVDSSGNVLTDRGGTVQLTLADAPAGAQLGGTTRGTLNYGVARFTNLTVAKAAANLKLAAQLGSQNASSQAFTVRPAAPAAMAVTTGPTDVDANGVLAPVSVTLRDAYGNVPEEVVSVTVALEGGTTGATLSGNTTATTVDGVATFTELSIDEDGEGYVLAFSAPSLTAAKTAAFKVRPAQPASLSFTTQPATSTVAGANLESVKVSLLDSRGKVAKKAEGSVTVELVASNGATLAGTLSATVAAGVASFDTLSIRKAGTGYLLRASFGSLTAADSSAFAIIPAAAARLAYVAAPAAATAGSAFEPAVQVELLDAYDNRTPSTATVEVGLGANPGNATLNGTRSVSAVDGLATFSNLSINVAAQGYTLTATSAGLDAATSGAFNVAHATVASVAFTTQPPAEVPAAEALSPAISVTASDAFGNVVTASTGTVSIALGTNPSGATLSGTTQVALANGVASFTTLAVDLAGTGYTLSATLDSVPPATSTAFNVTPAVASLALVAAPGNITAGNAFNPVIEAEFRDAGGNRVPSRATVTVRLAGNPAAGALVGTTSVAAVNGRAQFPGLTLHKAGTGYTLEVTSGSFTSAASGAFGVAPAAADQLVVTQQPPETVVAGADMGTLTVEVQDVYGNRIPTFGNLGETMSAGVDYDRNPNGASVYGTREVAVSNGVATFTGLSLDKTGDTEMVFVAYNAAFTEIYLGYSRPVAVTPAEAAGIAFNAVAETTPAGSAIGPAVQVRVTDRFGNATSGSGDVTLVLGANPGRDTLRGTLTAAVTDGVASFADLVLQKAGQGYTLKASLGALTPATSGPFAIVGAAPTRVEFVAQPRSTPNGLPLNEVAVRLVDAFDNTSTLEAPISLALGNANGAVLGGSVAVPAQAGVARFTDLTVDRGGQGYVLAATAGTLVGADSNAFNVYSASLAYTDPASGRIRLMRNTSSTDTRLVLDVVAAEELSGYGVGFNLPVDTTKVRLAAQDSITAGAILSVGASVPAVAVGLPTSGPLSGVLTSGISQKASGSGAVATDTTIPAGSVLYQLSLELAPGAEAGVVFDGANLGSRFKGLLRNKLGDDVVGSAGFGIGRLEIAADAGFQKTAHR
ncbi:beta strand repeat-containing protein [Pyxidicoccus trucidator]|uniref:beta strand repeat-containing protein n=1 Tax=Pyxidicoccus trucidator TaxID=2709662 RepID=UPI0013DC2136|nr:hypothetical protein [Pyxidicoccus trucidator]